ncbi:MAG: fumarylacetoacetate hydrolase family protein [Gammaproteobacteria bacterium]
MYLTRHLTSYGPRWAVDKHCMAETFSLSLLLSIPAHQAESLIEALQIDRSAEGDLLAPVDAEQEIWASGVTYLRSREARMHESETKDIYDKVYSAQRPELFYKASGWRAMGHGQPIRVRADSQWNVPEPELTLVINRFGEIVGYCAGNDVSSRDIEGENPLYLPQAKVYDGSAAIGPGIKLCGAEAMQDLPITLSISRAGQVAFSGETSVNQMKRSLEELTGCLFQELSFPNGALLMTGTCLVPPDDFTLSPGDSVRVGVGELVLENPVES